MHAAISVRTGSTSAMKAVASSPNMWILMLKPKRHANNHGYQSLQRLLWNASFTMRSVWLVTPAPNISMSRMLSAGTNNLAQDDGDCQNSIFYQEIIKEELAALSKSQQSFEFSKCAKSWAEQIRNKMNPVAPLEQRQAAIQILIHSCTTAMNLDLVIGFLNQETLLLETAPHYLNNIILKELANISSTISNAPHHAQSILDYLEKKNLSSSSSYNYVLEAWKNCASESVNNKAFRAQAVYDRMVAKKISPDSHALTLLIHLWGASSRGDAAFRATGHLLTLENRYLEQEKTIQQEAAAIHSPMEEPVHEGDPLCTATRFFHITVKEYEAVLHAWACCNETWNAPKRASIILRKMEQWHSRGILHFEPSVGCYRALLNTWKRCDGKDRYEAAVQASEIMSRMLQRFDDSRQPPPDATCFSTALSIMSHSSKRGMALKSQYFLQRMEQLSSMPSDTNMNVIKPTWINYTNVIQAFALSKDGDKTINAEKVLLRMERLYDEYGMASVRPNEASYIATISAHIRSNAPDKAKQALFILQHMNERNRTNNSNPKPTIETYNAVLRACARPSKNAELSDKQAALRIALRLTKALMTLQANRSPSGLKCNEDSYSLLLKCCSTLISINKDANNEELDKSVRFIFQQAARHGYVSNDVLEQLNAAAGSIMYKKLVGSDFVKDAISRIPPSWCRSLKMQPTDESSKQKDGKKDKRVPSDTLFFRKNKKLLQGGRQR